MPDAQRNWINDHTQYTHGFGFVAALGNETDGGRPSFVSSDIPPVGDLGDFEQPRIYFGQESPTYSIVGAPSGFDSAGARLPRRHRAARVSATRPTGQGRRGGRRGMFNKLLFAMKYQEANILLSGRVNTESKDPLRPGAGAAGQEGRALADPRRRPIPRGRRRGDQLDRRRLHDEQRLPLLDPQHASRTPRPTSRTVAANNQLVTPVARVNYIRNSVKATVDAYDGTVTLYQWDNEDPVLKTWMKAFPDTVAASLADQRRADGAPALPRGPVQGAADAARAVPRRARRRRSTAAATSGGSRTTRPAAGRRPSCSRRTTSRLQMPGQAEPSFSLTSTFVPTGDRNNLSAFVAVNADPGPDYGKFRVLQLTTIAADQRAVSGAEPARVRRRHRRADQHPQARYDGEVRQPADLPGRRRPALRRAGVRAGGGDDVVPAAPQGAGVLRQRGGLRGHLGGGAGHTVRQPGR